MIEHWALIVGDFRREYGVTSDELAGWGTADFALHLSALSADAMFRNAVQRDGPAELSEAQAARALGHPLTT